MSWKLGKTVRKKNFGIKWLPLCDLSFFIDKMIITPYASQSNVGIEAQKVFYIMVCTQ